MSTALESDEAGMVLDQHVGDAFAVLALIERTAQQHGVPLAEDDMLLLRGHALAFVECEDELRDIVAWELVNEINRHLAKRKHLHRFWRAAPGSSTWLLLTPEQAARSLAAGRPIRDKKPDPSRGMLLPALAVLGATVFMLGTVVLTLIRIEAYVALLCSVGMVVVSTVAAKKLDADKLAHVYLATAMSFSPFAIAAGALVWARRRDLAAWVVAATALSILARLWTHRAATRANSEDA